MSQTYIPVELLRLVISRADRRCEYFHIHENDTYFGCEVDHVISEKHSGPTVAENLAYACLVCNRNKGSDLGSMLEPGGALIRSFNPRVDSMVRGFLSRWGTHQSPRPNWPGHRAHLQI